MVSEPSPSPPTPSPSPSPSSFAKARDALSSSLVDLSHRLEVFQADLTAMFQAIDVKLQQFQTCIKADGEMETKPDVDSILQQPIVDPRPGSSVLDSISISVSPPFHQGHRMESLLKMPLDVARSVSCIKIDCERDTTMDITDSKIIGSVGMNSYLVLPPAHVDILGPLIGIHDKADPQFIREIMTKSSVDALLTTTVKISFESAFTFKEATEESSQVMISEVPFVRCMLVLDAHETAYHGKLEFLPILAQEMFDIMLPPPRPPSDVIFFHVGIAGNVCQVCDEVSVAWMLPKMAFFSLYLFTHIQCCDGYVYRPPPKPPPYMPSRSLHWTLQATC